MHRPICKHEIVSSGKVCVFHTTKLVYTKLKIVLHIRPLTSCNAKPNPTIYRFFTNTFLSYKCDLRNNKYIKNIP